MGVRLAALTLSLLATAALAEPPVFEAPPDGLTVRAAPGGEVVGTLAPGQRVEATASDGAWVRVAFGEGDAWAAVDALRRVEVPRLAATRLPVGLTCTGTEPFWSLTLAPEAVVWRTPDSETPWGVFATAPATGQQAFPVLLTLMRESRSMLAIIRHGACTDGMSDRTQAWHAEVVTQTPDGAGGVLTLHTGCCRLP
jgi:uncharacterized membrane protein